MKNLILVLVLMALTGLIVYGGMGGFGSEEKPAPDQESSTEVLSTELDFRNKLAEVRMDREHVERAIEKLQKRKSENVEFLKSNGIKKVADARGDDAAELALRNLKAYSEDIKKLTGEMAIYDSALTRIDGMLKDIERKQINQDAGFTEAQEIELRTIVRDLNERLNLNENDIFRDAEMDKLLDEELGDSDSDRSESDKLLDN